MSGPSDTSIEKIRESLTNKDRLEPIVQGRRQFSWRYRSYELLLKQLGHSDGMAECIEVAVRDFIDAARATGQPQAYLKQRAKAQNIIVHEFDYESIPSRASNFYFFAVGQQMEEFLEQFVAEYLRFHGQVARIRQNKESLLDYVLDILPGGLKKNQIRIWRERYAVLEYYRRIRNNFAHTKIDLKRTAKLYEEVCIYKPLFISDYRLNAPNKISAINFEDFLLFTRLVKYMATDLVRMSGPSSEEIVEFAVRSYRDGDIAFRKLPFEAKHENKLSRKICKILTGTYRANKISENPNLVDEIANRLIESRLRS